MDNKRGYVPDVSSFFDDGRKHTVIEIFELPEISQETVSFEVNDLYLNSYNNGYSARVGETNRGMLRKKQVCRKFVMKKRRRRRFNGNFKGT